MRRDGLSPKAESDIDRMIDRWNAKSIPLGLAKRQAERTGSPRMCDEPVPVTVSLQMIRTWVDDALLDGEVIAYTPRAVLVRVKIPGWEEPQDVWVWANAVQRKAPKRPTPPRGAGPGARAGS